MKQENIQYLKNVDSNLRGLLKSIPFVGKVSKFASHIAFGGLGAMTLIWILQSFILKLFIKGYTKYGLTPDFSSLYSLFDGGSENVKLITNLNKFLGFLDSTAFVLMGIGILLLFILSNHKYLLYSVLGYILYNLLLKINFGESINFSISFRGLFDILIWAVFAYAIKIVMDAKKEETDVNSEDTVSF